MNLVLRCVNAFLCSMCPHHETRLECPVCVDVVIVFDRVPFDSMLLHVVSLPQRVIAVNRRHLISAHLAIIHVPSGNKQNYDKNKVNFCSFFFFFFFHLSSTRILTSSNAFVRWGKPAATSHSASNSPSAKKRRKLSLNTAARNKNIF